MITHCIAPEPTEQDWRIVPETEDLDIAREGEAVAFWTVFYGPNDWRVFGQFPTSEAARAAVAT